MDNTAQFVSNLNVARFEDRLRFEHDPAIRASLQRLLLEEEDKLGCRVERLGNVQRHTRLGSVSSTGGICSKAAAPARKLCLLWSLTSPVS
jgi:hypothetical protein